MRLSTRVWPSLVDLGVLLPQRALPWKRGPNPGLGSRSRLAVYVREHGLQLVDHWSSLLRLVGRLHSTTGDPSSVPSSQMGTAQRSLSMLWTSGLAKRASHLIQIRLSSPLYAHDNFVSIPHLSLIFPPRVLRRPTDSLAPRRGSKIPVRRVIWVAPASFCLVWGVSVEMRPLPPEVLSK